MELIEWILQDSNIAKAIEQVKRNRGAASIDKMTVDEVESYFAKHGEEIKTQIRNKQYKPTPVKRVYIPNHHALRHHCERKRISAIIRVETTT